MVILMSLGNVHFKFWGSEETLYIGGIWETRHMVFLILEIVNFTKPNSRQVASKI